MAVEVNLLNSNSTTNIATNFQRVKTALQDAVSRGGDLPNDMQADLDMNSNDILNVNELYADSILINGLPIGQFNGTYRGEWSNVTNYVVNDVVRDSAGNLWIAKKNNSNSLPTEGNNWTLFMPIPDGVTDGDKGDIIVHNSGTEWLITKNYKTVSDLLADDGTGPVGMGYEGSGAQVTVAPGDIITAQGFRYEVAASDATDEHIETTGGVKLYVLEGRHGYDIQAFGAVADGDGTGGGTDNATAIQSTIDYVASLENGGTVRVPRGIYRCDSALNVYSNVRLMGEGRSSVIDYTNKVAGRLIFGSGTYGDELPIAANVLRSATILQCTSHPFANGDYIILKSQRNALTADAGNDQTGLATGGSSGAYFGETFQVRDAAENSFRLSASLRFTGYRTDATQDPNSDRAYATVAKVDWLDGVVIENLHIIPGQGANGIYLNYSKDCVVRNVTIDWPKDENVFGDFIRIEHSLNTYAEGCVSTIPAGWVVDQEDGGAGHDSWNWFKIVGGWSCGFVRCKAYNGSQPFDVSYRGGGMIAVDWYWLNCESYDCPHDSFTTHSGAWSGSSIGCRSYGAHTGINLRSRGTVVSDYRYYGRSGGSANGTIGGQDWEAAVRINNGWATHTKFSDCYFEDANYGFRINRSGSQGDGPAAQHLVIENVTMRRVSTEFLFLGGLTTNEDCAVLLSNITSLRKQYGFSCVHVEGYWNNLVIDGYSVIGPFSGSVVAAPIFQFAQCYRPYLRAKIIGNLSPDVVGASVGALSDATTFPPATFRAVGADIEIEVVSGTLGALVTGAGLPRSAFGPNVQDAPIVSGVVRLFRGRSFQTLIVDTEDQDPTDNLNTIIAPSHLPSGTIVFLRTLSNSRAVTVVHNSGNIRLAGQTNVTLDSSHDMLMLWYDSALDGWKQVAMTNNG